MAGSGIRGQFEEKFKALLRDIEDEVRQIPPSLPYSPPLLFHSIPPIKMNADLPLDSLLNVYIGRERDLFHRRSS